jgi:hemoglobin/transferrin/lactoferrin receptor protein
MTICKDERPIQAHSRAITQAGALVLTLVITTPALVAQATEAQENQASVQAFDSITVMGEQQDETPWATRTDRQTLEQQQVLNFQQFGSRIEPGVNFNTSNNSINIRGLDQSRVVTRIDGIRQPYLSDIRGTMGGVSGAVSSIDFNSLATIDIVRGADSSSVGSGAMGGVLDLRTLEPDDLLSGSSPLGAVARTGYFSVDRSWLVNAALAGQTAQGFKWLLQAGAQLGHETRNQGTVGGYGVTRSQPNPDNYTQQNYLLKLQQTFAGNHIVGLTGAFFERQDDVDDRTANPATYVPGQSKLVKNARRQSVALDYGWAADGSGAIIDTVAAQAYWQQSKITSNFNANRIAVPRGLYQRGNEIKQDNYGLQFEATKRLDGTISQDWTFGADWLESNLTQFASGRDSCPPPPHVGRFFGCRFFHNNQSDVPNTRGSQYAVWAQNTVGLFSDRLLFTPGLRYDHFEYRPSSTSLGGNPTATAFNNNSGQSWSPKLKAQWRATNSLSLFAQYAYSFNAPTATQLYSRFGSPGTYLVSGNPNLKPEKGRGWELGAQFENQALAASLTFFDNRYSNFIESVSGPGTPVYPFFVESFENLDNVRIYGLEARSEWRVNANWRVFGSLAWAVGRDQTRDRYLNSVAPLQAIAGLTYVEPSWGATAQVSTAAARTKVARPGVDFEAPGYAVVDLTAYWQVSNIKGLRLQVGVFNLLDKTYWNALDVPVSPALPLGAYTQPGRNFAVSLTYQY